MQDDIIQQQIAYYRARAGEYDEWFYRIGRYDHGPALNQQWFDESAQVMRALHAIGPVRHTLELACGTGIWTSELLRISEQITAIDASAEVLALNREKQQADPRIRYQQADLFQWEPDTTYDLVFFSFWLSHVPPDALDPFLTRVRRATSMGGRVFIVDSLKDDTSTARDHPLRGDEETYRTRKLNSGQTFTIVKIFYTPAELAAILERHGFAPIVNTSGRYFIYADAVAR